MTSDPDATPLPWSLILLTGGTARRLGGIDKATVDIAGTTPLAVLLEALPADVRVIVAGDPVPTTRPVTFCREDPPGSGPAAAVAATLTHIDADLVGLLAVDMPWSVPVLRQAVDLLRTADGSDAVVPVDAAGRRQLLCSAWHTAALRRSVAAAGDLTDRPMRDLLAHVRVVELPVPEGDDLSDIDTPDDLDRARHRARQQARRP